MGTVHERVDKYWAEMQRQPENVAAIQQSLVATLNASRSSATDSRNAAYAAFGASAQVLRRPFVDKCGAGARLGPIAHT